MCSHGLIGCVVAALQDGATAAIRAVSNGHGQCLKALVEAKADVNLQDKVSGWVVRGVGAWSLTAQAIAGVDGAPQVVLLWLTRVPNLYTHCACPPSRRTHAHARTNIHSGNTYVSTCKAVSTNTCLENMCGCATLCD
jgi:hypothetical protein